MAGPQTPQKPAPSTEAQTQPMPRGGRAHEAEDYGRKPTHLLARSRTPRFNRAGLSFTSTYQAFDLSDLKREQVDRVMAEPMLDARLVDRAEVERHVELAQAVSSGDVSPAELAQQLMRMRAELVASNERIRMLEAKLAGADLPPTSTDKLPGGASLPR